MTVPAEKLKRVGHAHGRGPGNHPELFVHHQSVWNRGVPSNNRAGRARLQLGRRLKLPPAYRNSSIVTRNPQPASDEPRLKRKPLSTSLQSEICNASAPGLTSVA
jgi:hypothetical protein